MQCWTGDPERSEYDVVVAGSGAAGLLAAIVAARSGRSVAVLEKARWLGGTSAISGGTLWVPGNPYLRAAGLADSREAARSYLATLTDGHSSPAVLDAFVDNGPRMIELLGELGIGFAIARDYPDYRPDIPGSVPSGRSLDPDFYESSRLGPLVEALRPDRRPPFTMAEYAEWLAVTRYPWSELEERRRRGVLSRGNALVAALVEACRDAGVVLVTEAPAEDLVSAGRGVTGVVAAGRVFRAARGVILACGGFEWNRQMVGAHLSGPLDARCSPPHNTGDGIRMGLAVGAAVANLGEAFWGPMALIDTDRTEGAQLSSLLRFERQGPGSIIVNAHGERFANESQNYNDMTRRMHRLDPETAGGYRNLPAWAVFDHDYLTRYGVFDHRVEAELPDWLVRADSLEALAAALGLPEGALTATVTRFNGFARDGRDVDFGRGEDAYDRYWGDRRRGLPNPCLAPLEQAPFYALRVHPGGFGTCGGLATDGLGRVLDEAGAPIEGLYAVGNTTAHPMGRGYPGAGGSLGPNLTMGLLAGEAAAGGGTVTTLPGEDGAAPRRPGTFGP